MVKSRTCPLARQGLQHQFIPCKVTAGESWHSVRAVARPPEPGGAAGCEAMADAICVRKRDNP